MDDPDAYQAMARAHNPYGDGQAATRVLGALRYFLGRGERPEEFRGREPASSPPAAGG